MQILIERRLCFFVLLLVIRLGSGCTALQSTTDYESQIALLQEQLVQDTGNAKLLRDLGLVYLQAARNDEALATLRRAYELTPTDPDVQYHYGLALETNGAMADAMAVYGQYGAAPRVSSYRHKMEARYTVLIGEALRKEIRMRLADEASYQQVPPRTLAIFPFIYQGYNPQYALLGRGLAEMLAVDLSQVQSLEVVERVRVEILLEEVSLALGTDPATDPQAAARAGRLLGAQQIVAGTYNVMAGNRLRLDVLAYTLDAEPVALDTRTDALADFFALEKDLVFSLLDAMQIQPTLAEREAIEEVPTRNFQAFLAYSQGLTAAIDGQYEAAARYFQQAQQFDPGFADASQQARLAEVTSATTIPLAQAQAGGQGAHRQHSLSRSHRLVRNRQQNMRRTLGGGFVPGPDHRRPAAEASEAGADGFPPPRHQPRRDNN